MGLGQGLGGLLWGVGLGSRDLILIPCPLQVIRRLDPAPGAMGSLLGVQALRNQLQEKEAKLQYLEVREAQCRGGKGHPRGPSPPPY